MLVIMKDNGQIYQFLAISIQSIKLEKYYKLKTYRIMHFQKYMIHFTINHIVLKMHNAKSFH